MNYNLDIGINLNDRFLYLSIPNNSNITEFKYICKTDNNNYLAEDSTGGYYHYEGEDTYFYKPNDINLESIKLPDDFGIIFEIDETSVLFEYIERVSHEKVYVTTEDWAKEESLPKSAIIGEIEEGVRSYGVPTGSIMGYDGETIPGGFEVTSEGVLNEYSESTEDPYSANYINDALIDIYSTSETKTNKKFLDKDVYRKMYLITTTNNSNIGQAHGLTNLDKFWINYDASYIFDGNESLPPMWYYNTNDWGRLWVNTTEVRFRSPSSLGTRTLYAVVEYTKTTD